MIAALLGISFGSVCLLGHSLRNRDFIYHTPMIPPRLMRRTTESSHITQLDSPICEANEGELCDQFECCGEVLDSYTKTQLYNS